MGGDWTESAEESDAQPSWDCSSSTSSFAALRELQSVFDELFMVGGARRDEGFGKSWPSTTWSRS